ncbi:MAG: NAD(P)-binding domain-containing protein [Acidimicrobiales bacterium]
MNVTIVGAGNMGRGIDSRAVAGGNEVELVDRNPEDSRTLAEELGPLARITQGVTGDVVVLALRERYLTAMVSGAGSPQPVAERGSCSCRR